MKQMKVCPHCHQPVSGSSRYCMHCGADLSAETKTERKKQMPAWTAIVIAGALMLVIGFAVSLMPKKASISGTFTDTDAQVTLILNADHTLSYTAGSDTYSGTWSKETEEDVWQCDAEDGSGSTVHLTFAMADNRMILFASNDSWTAQRYVLMKSS
ncbi:MAG: zinc ribbon domain-containing protein [Lactimicrobium sp.]|jgi:hypothetical protein|uniref:zinc ribbon domain-containing protein n=1 Tax=Lactimicrobium sp. TaxID=2563780 RepID=UPI002F3576F1